MGGATNIVVGVADARISADPGAALATYSLGSCIGVALYDPVARLGGLLHYQLPTAALDAARARDKPLMFADTGMDCLLKSMEEHGGVRRRMTVKLAGGADILDDARVFDIGRRNHTAIRQILWRQGMSVDAEDVGGTAPRTLYLRVADGAVTVRTERGTSTL